MGALTVPEVKTLITVERTTASISVTATLILIAAYVWIKKLQTMSNTLIFYASFANLFANVAALIGGAALGNPGGHLCQFQGFLLEMFMLSDPLWSCAMAVNVFLVFFFRYDAERLKRLYWVYGVVCYGGPFIPAMLFLFYKTSKTTDKIYGDATLWCWIDDDDAPLRIWSYYLFIWISIGVTLVVYFLVGIRIFSSRSKLRAAANDSKNDVYASNTPSSVRSRNIQTSAKPAAFSGMRTTEIQVSTDQWVQEVLKSPASVYAREDSNTSEPPPKDQYSIEITGASRKKSGFHMHMPRFRRPNSMDQVKWEYSKTALLFAISILITWVPASVNRIYGLRNPANPSFVLNILSAIVLPLQGFWNAVIFFSTSGQICRVVYAEYKKKRANTHTATNDTRAVNIQHLGGRRDGGPARGTFIGRPRRDTWRGLKDSVGSFEMSDHDGDGDSSDRGRCRSPLEERREAYH